MLAATMLLSWSQGWNPLLVGALTLAAASTGFLLRHGMRSPLPESDTTPEMPETAPPRTGQDAPGLLATQPDIRMVPQRWLQLSKEIADIAHQSHTLTEAVSQVGGRLHQVLGSQAWHCLRVEDWNGDSGLLRPWWEFEGKDADHIDPTSMAPVVAHDQPLGKALTLRQHCLADMPNDASKVSHTTPWRAEKARQILAVPLFVGQQPLAILEYIDPAPLSTESHLLLQLAVVQLGFVAQRDEGLHRAADSAEHLGRLGLVASRISSGVALLDSDGVVEWVNPMFTELTGWPASDVLGRKLPSLFEHSAPGQAIAQQIQAHLHAGGPFRVHYEDTRLTGESRHMPWVELDAIVTLGEAGGKGQYVCLFNDISQRKHTEHIQQQEKEFLEALMGNLPVSLLVMDPQDFSIVAINRFTEHELELKTEDVLKHPLSDIIGPDVRHAVEPRMREALQSGVTIEHDFEWPTAQGKRVVNARHFALRHADGSPRLLITLARDITQTRQATADLEESERRFRELVESMDDGVYVATAGHQHITYQSPRMGDLFGLSQNGPHSHHEHFLSLVLAADRPTLLDADHQCDRQAPTDVIVRIQHPLKGLRWVRRRTRSRRLDDGQLRIYGLVSDVTDERERSDELQRARDVAENASQAKSQFMASMSHEIRTPMNAILGMTELLLSSQLTASQRKQAQVVFRSGESLLEIINDILDFSKIEAGRQELAPVDFSLQTLLDDTLELLAPRAHEKGIEITAHVEPGLPSQVHADSLRLQQVLTNLIGNAIKFTESGEVVVSIGRAQEGPVFAEQEVGDTVMLAISVRDTGIGIQSDVLPRLFQAFMQANAGLSRRYGGTGLGLAICKQLVTLMGGDIEVHSAPGVGSEFTFTLPVQVADGVSQFGMLDESDLPAMHVLVVDDNATNLTVIENLLSAWGMQVTRASDGQEALDLLLAAPHDLDIDLALVDMKMPRMDGMAFAKALKASGRYQALKMVMLSSISSVDDVRQAHDAGYERFLAKPLRKIELRQALLGLSADMATPQAELPRLKLNVLVVEDNQINQELCHQMLAKLGCRATLAGSAMEGLRKLTQDTFDVVLMDIQMPGMDGTEALQVFRHNRHLRFKFTTPPQTPVVAVTANALEGDDHRFLACGFDAYLSKPFRMHQLAKVLQTVMHSSNAKVPNGDPSIRTTPPDVPVSEPTHPSNSTPAMSTQNAQTANWREVFDEIAVQRLVELDPSGHNALIERVTKMFASSVDKYLAQLDAAQQSQDARTIRDVAHTLKSSSANLGALKLSQACVEIENAIREETGEDLTEMIQRLHHEARTVLAALPSLAEATR